MWQMYSNPQGGGRGSNPQPALERRAEKVCNRWRENNVGICGRNPQSARHTRYSFWRRNLSHNSLSCQIPSFYSEERALPRLIRCKLSCLRCLGYSLLLSSYLCRIKIGRILAALMAILCRI